MTAVILSVVCALLIWLVGRRDPARDPRLTTLALALAAAAPIFPFLPKFSLLPAALPVADFSIDAGGGMGWLGWIWLAGAVVALVRLGAGMFRLGRWHRASARIGRVAIGRRREAELRLLAGLRSPVAAGIFRPVVYLPAAWNHWPDDVRSAVLAHELAHLENRDPLRRLIAALACAVNWFNPLVHWMARRLEAQCEFGSDARVLAAGFRAADYARLLCDLAENSREPLGAVAMARAGGMGQRVERLLAGRRPVVSGRRLFVLSASLALATAAGLALLGPAAPASVGSEIDAGEVQLRLAADPFPGNP
jgi:beta-lactamase regulating signal transducer with metallopeptidase domain